MKRNQNLIGTLILGLAALVWGGSFSVQSVAADKGIKGFQLNGIRCLIGAAALLILLVVMQRIKREPLVPKSPDVRKRLLIGGIVCGIFLAISVNFQNFGIIFYPDGVPTEARTSFLTALYVILVPIFSVFLGKKLPPPVILGALVATVGIYLLCLSEGLDGFYFADVLVLICAVTFALHILAIGHFGAGLDGVMLSAAQFLVCGVISMILSLCFEQFVWEDVKSALPQILYMGLGSTGMGYTLQVIGQKYATPTVASITMSLESVFGALIGWMVLGNALNGAEIVGCSLMFVAIILAQIPFEFKKKPKDQNAVG